MRHVVGDVALGPSPRHEPLRGQKAQNNQSLNLYSLFLRNTLQKVLQNDLEQRVGLEHNMTGLVVDRPEKTGDGQGLGSKVIGDNCVNIL